MASCNASSTCRIDWRPSRLLVSALIALAVLAPASLWLSALPRWLAVPAALVAMVRGLHLARREALRAPRQFTWPGGDADAEVTGPEGSTLWQDVQVRQRGPMASVSGRDGTGRRRRLVWWPDTLPVPARRALRLATQVSRRSPKTLRQLAA